jgi:hypothetical protein
MVPQEKLLRAAFIAGSITDALAIVPMVVPPLARLMWGCDDSSIVGVLSGSLAWLRMLPTWCVQAVLLGLFAGAFHHRTVEECLATRARGGNDRHRRSG